MNILKILTSKRKLGNEGERAAADFLRKSGYKILERNYVSGGAEVDIICTKGDILAFVEVKARTVGRQSPMEPRPASSVTPDKQQKILRVAGHYKSTHPSDKKIRFDIVEVMTSDNGGNTQIEDVKHLLGAFDKDSAYPKRFVRG